MPLLDLVPVAPADALVDLLVVLPPGLDVGLHAAQGGRRLRAAAGHALVQGLEVLVRELGRHVFREEVGGVLGAQHLLVLYAPPDSHLLDPQALSPVRQLTELYQT